MASRKAATGLVGRVLARPAAPEPLTPERIAWFGRFAVVVGVTAIAIDLGLLGLLGGDPRVDRTALTTFAAINLPILVVLAGAGLWLVRHPSRGAWIAIPSIALAQVTVVVWVQMTGTLTSYFVAAGALIAGFHRVLLSWRHGLISMLAIAGLHVAAFVLEELGWLPRAPLFQEGPGAIYGSAQLRWSVLTSIVSVYFLTWAGVNVLVAALRETEGALVQAERRLAEVAEGARHGRLTGRRLDDRWQLLEVIGRGGMGEVYRAVAVGGAEEVAIKIMHPHLADDEQMLARFRREADVASRVPATIGPALLEAHLTGPRDRYLVMEYLRGEDLAQLMRRRGRLPPGEAAALIVAAARVIAGLHALGIVHRDLKPHNLFAIDEATPELRLLDFGIARGQHDLELTAAAQIVGTPGYIAPEHLLDGGGRVGPEADVFALAVIAFQLVTGQRPLPARDRGATPVEPVAATALDPDLPADLDLLFTLALARSPSQRLATVDELAAGFAAAIGPGLGPELRRRAIALADRRTSFEDTLVAQGG
jgi:hypothetical protein